MFAARCTSDAVITAIDKLNVQAEVSVASVNGPKSVVIAGAEAEVAAVLGELSEKGQRLSVSHAFHSPLMVPMAEEYRAVVASLSELGALSCSPPQVPVVNTVTGNVASAKELADPEHWVRQVWSPVLFSGALETALGQWSGKEFSPCVVLEVGPNPVLSRMARPWVGSGRVAAWCTSLNRQAGLDDVETTQKAAAIMDEHLNKPPTMLGALDRVFPNRRAFPWQTPPHPLLQQTQVIEDDGVTRHKAVFHGELMGLFKDHTVQGRCLFPGAGFVEMALAAAAYGVGGKRSSAAKDGQIILQDVAFLEPLDLEVGSALVCEVPADGRGVEFRPAGEPDRVVCSVGGVGTDRTSTPASSSASSLSEARARCVEEIAGVSKRYAELEERGFHGPQFQTLSQVWQSVGRDEVVAKLCVPAALSSERYHVHPAVLDGVFQLASFVLDEANEGHMVWTPTQLDEMDFLTKPTLGFCDTNKYMWDHLCLSQTACSGPDRRIPPCPIA